MDNPSDQGASIFETTPNSNVPAPQAASEVTPKATSYDDLLAMITKEDGSPKYRSVDDAIKSIPHAQTHISNLERELQNLREQLNRNKTAEELLETFKPAKQEATPSKPAVDLNDIDSLIAQNIQKHEQTKVAVSNVNKVMETLSTTYGDKANELYKKAAQDAGISVSEMNRLAASSPNAVFKLIGLDNKGTQSPSKSNSNINTEVFTQQNQAPNVSAKVTGNTTKDLTSSWRNAGTIVKQKLGVN